MRTTRVIMMRTFGVLAGSLSTTLAVMVFLGVSGGLFAKALLAGEGGLTPVAVLWALSAAPALPVLAAVLTMRLVADERTSGRLELVLSAPLRERDVIVGKFLGAWLHAALALALYLTVPLVLLPRCAPALAAHLAWDVFLPAYGALALQAALWCACGLLASACFRPAAVAAVVSLVMTVVLPFAAYQAAFTWLQAFRVRFSEHPFTGHLVDISTGLVRFSTLFLYVALTVCALFAASKALALLRLAGRGWRGARLSTACTVLLGFAFAACSILFVERFNFSLELPMRGAFSASERTRQILRETSGEPVSVTCFLSRRAPAYRAVSRLLRGLEATAHGVAGVQLSVTGVDPRWDLGAAERLVKAGVPEGTLLFRQGRRQVTVPVGDLFAGATNGTLTVTTEGLFEAESACATAMQRLSVAGRRGTLYWTTGHGESSADSYDAVYGMSDMAREFRQNGYRITAIDLAQTATVPEDCAVLVVAGAREPFSRTELQRVEGYLRGGGRLAQRRRGFAPSGLGRATAAVHGRLPVAYLQRRGRVDDGPRRPCGDAAARGLHASLRERLRAAADGGGGHERGGGGTCGVGGPHGILRSCPHRRGQLGGDGAGGAALGVRSAHGAARAARPGGGARARRRRGEGPRVPSHAHRGGGRRDVRLERRARAPREREPRFPAQRRRVARGP